MGEPKTKNKGFYNVFVRVIYAVAIVTVLAVLFEIIINKAVIYYKTHAGDKPYENVCNYTTIALTDLQTGDTEIAELKGLQVLQLKSSENTADMRTTKTDYHKLTCSLEIFEEIETSRDIIQRDISERYKLHNDISNTESCVEFEPETGNCIGYFKYNTELRAGNAAYQIPIVSVCYVKPLSEQYYLKYSLEMSANVYDAAIAETVLTEFLGFAGNNWNVPDLLSVTDENGNKHRPVITFKYTDSKYFEFDSKTGTILEYRIKDKGAPTEVFVPEQIGGVPVRAIGDNAFYKYTETERSVTSVVIPDTVTVIGENAFLACSDMSYLRLSENTVTIGDSAFSGCSSLESIKLPSMVTILPASCFKGDTALREVTNTEGIQQYYNTTFEGCPINTDNLFGEGVICHQD